MTYHASNPNQRRHGRVHLQHITSSLGPVLDLSASGMRIRTRRTWYTKGARIRVEIRGLETPFKVECEVVWGRRAGFFRRGQLGVRFRGLTPAQRTALAQLARTAPSNDTIAQDVARMRQSA